MMKLANVVKVLIVDIYNIGAMYIGLVYGKMFADLCVDCIELYYHIYLIVALLVYALFKGIMIMLIKAVNNELEEDE